MFDSLSRAIAISALVLGGLGVAAVLADRADRHDFVATSALAGSEVEATVKTRQTISAHSSATASSSASASSSVSVSTSASSSSRATAGAGQGARSGECAADATATTVVDGKRVTVRKSDRSAEGQGPCSADARVELRSGGSRQETD